MASYTYNVFRLLANGSLQELSSSSASVRQFGEGTGGEGSFRHFRLLNSSDYSLVDANHFRYAIQCKNIHLAYLKTIVRSSRLQAVGWFAL